MRHFQVGMKHLCFAPFILVMPVVEYMKIQSSMFSVSISCIYMILFTTYYKTYVPDLVPSESFKARLRALHVDLFSNTLTKTKD